MSEERDVGGLVGTLLAGRYRVLEKLGEGAMGAVYLAEHTRIGRKDAIKVLRDALARDPEAIARFLRGTRNLSAIRHPNICAVYDFTETEDGLRFVAMEYVDGPTLKDVLDRERVLPLERAVDIARQIADGLDAAHEVGVVHRDLKPGNIMILAGRGGRDVVKVVDFDIANGPEGGDEVTRSGFVVGTPEYMSPEQLMGEPLDGRSDVYALALVLCRMLTGRLPFPGEGAQDIMIARLTSEPMKLAECRPGLVVPPGIQAAIDRALQRRPADRQTGAEEFGREIVAAVQAPLNAAPASLAAADVPPTRVAPAWSPPSGEQTIPQPAATAASPRPRSRRSIPMLSGLGAAAVAIIGAILVTRPSASEPGDGVLPGDTAAQALNTMDTDEDTGGVTTVTDTATGTQQQTGDSGVTGGRDTASDRTGGTTRGTDGGSGDTGTGGNETSSRRLAMSGEEVIDRFLMLTDGVAPPTNRLRGIADTLTLAFEQNPDAATRRSLALLLAYVEYYRRNDAECRRWIDQIERLGGTVNATVRSLCPTEEP